MITIDKDTKTVTISEKINVAKFLNILADATDCNFDDWGINPDIKVVNLGINPKSDGWLYNKFLSKEQVEKIAKFMPDDNINFEKELL